MLEIKELNTVNESVKVEIDKYGGKLPSGKPMLEINNKDTEIYLCMGYNKDKHELYINLDSMTLFGLERYYIMYREHEETDMVSDFNKFAKDIADNMDLGKFMSKWGRRMSWRSK